MEEEDLPGFWGIIEAEVNAIIATQYGGEVPTPTELLADILLFARELD